MLPLIKIIDGKEHTDTSKIHQMTPGRTHLTSGSTSTDQREMKFLCGRNPHPRQTHCVSHVQPHAPNHNKVSAALLYISLDLLNLPKCCVETRLRLGPSF